MSRGPTTQVAFIQGNQSTREHDASHSTQHSALFYLFQEVSKLASPIHNSFVDSNPPSMWLNEHTRQGPLIGKKEEEDAYSYEVSNSSCQLGLPHISPYNQMKKVKDKSSKVATLVETYPECNSPWRVLSLINLQCEKLLQHSDVEGLNTSSVSSAAKVGHPIDSTAAAHVTDRQVGVDCISVECSFRPSVCIFDREEIPAHVSHQEDTRVCSEEASGHKPESCAKDPNMDICVHSRPAGKIDSIKPAVVKDNATGSSQPHPTDKGEDKFSVNRQFEWNPDCKKDCVSSEQDIRNVPLYVSSSTTHIPDADVEANVPLSKPSLTYDCNANLALITAPPCITQLNPLSATLPSLPSSSLLFNIKEKCHSLPKQGDKSRASQLDCTCVPIEEKSPPAAQLKPSGCNGETNSASCAASKPKPRPMQEEDPPTTQSWRTKTPRKQPHPSRSVDIQDPDFQGVTFRMDTELDDSREQCRLLITSKYRLWPIAYISREFSKFVVTWNFHTLSMSAAYLPIAAKCSARV